MVFIIAGTPESDRNTVSRLFAETLAWEFVDAENLRIQGNVDTAWGGTSPAHPHRISCTEALSAAINLWIYEWRDVVVSSPLLTEGERRQLSKISSLIKIVCLDEFRTPDRTCVPDELRGVAISQSPAASHASRDSAKDVSTLELLRPVEEVIEELTALLVA